VAAGTCAGAATTKAIAKTEHMNLMMKSGFMACLLVDVAFQTIGRVFFRQLKKAIYMPRGQLPLTA
jgi:hypothetical protein